jgi:hypothetical protein
VAHRHPYGWLFPSMRAEDVRFSAG